MAKNKQTDSAAHEIKGWKLIYSMYHLESSLKLKRIFIWHETDGWISDRDVDSGWSLEYFFYQLVEQSVK